MQVEHFYDVSINWKQDRVGVASSEVLPSNIEVATPPEFPKGVAGVWSPEHFFVAAVNSCLMTTFLAIAENSKLEFQSFQSKAIGKLEMIEDKLMISTITLMPTVQIADELQKERAEKVLHKAAAACLITNSIKSKIIFLPEIIVATMAE
jgi:peroxiredoxin-like protein